MKKINKLLGLYLLFTSSLSASTFYLGSNVNYSHLNSKTHAGSHIHDCHHTAPDLTMTYLFTHSSKRHHLSAILGYHYQYRNVVGGLEYYYDFPTNLSSSYVHQNGSSYTNSMKARTAHGLALKGGYFVTPNSLAFAKFILEKRDFKVGIERKENYSHIQDYEKSTSYQSTGRGVGLGVEHNFGKNWVLNLEYKIVQYPSKTFQYDTALNTTIRENQKFRINPSISTVMIGVIYRFA